MVDNYDTIVSLEVANLLKEKGFKDWCSHCYTTAVLHRGQEIDFDEECELKDEGRGDEIEYIDGGSLTHIGCSNKDDIKAYAAPTVTQALKWVEKQEYIGYVYPVHDGKKIMWMFEIWFDNSHMFLGQILTYSDNKTYEKRDEAIEALLQYALKELV